MQKHAIPGLLAVTMMSLVGCGGVDDIHRKESDALQASASALTRPGPGAHAREVYSHHQDASGGRFAFELAVLKSGRVTDVMDQPIQALVSVPDYWLVVQSMGTDISSVSREARDPATDEWASPAQ